MRNESFGMKPQSRLPAVDVIPSVSYATRALFKHASGVVGKALAHEDARAAFKVRGAA